MITYIYIFIYKNSLFGEYPPYQSKTMVSSSRLGLPRATAATWRTWCFASPADVVRPLGCNYRGSHADGINTPAKMAYFCSIFCLNSPRAAAGYAIWSICLFGTDMWGGKSGLFETQMAYARRSVDAIKLGLCIAFANENMVIDSWKHARKIWWFSH